VLVGRGALKGGSSRVPSGYNNTNLFLQSPAAPHPQSTRRRSELINLERKMGRSCDLFPSHVKPIVSGMMCDYTSRAPVTRCFCMVEDIQGLQTLKSPCHPAAIHVSHGRVRSQPSDGHAQKSRQSPCESSIFVSLKNHIHSAS